MFVPCQSALVMLLEVLDGVSMWLAQAVPFFVLVITASVHGSCSASLLHLLKGTVLRLLLPTIFLKRGNRVSHITRVGQNGTWGM